MLGLKPLALAVAKVRKLAVAPSRGCPLGFVMVVAMVKIVWCTSCGDV